MNAIKPSLKTALVKHAFDFFILFLAVTLGFLADNYRDKLESKESVHQLTAGLISDISSDSVNINVMVAHAESKKTKLDSLYNLISDTQITFDDSLIYLYSACVNHRPFFERHAATFFELTSTDNLQNFTHDASSSLSEYNIDCIKLIEALKSERVQLESKIFPFQQQIFHTENFQSISENKTMIIKPVLRNWNQDTRWIYHNYIIELQIINDVILFHYKELASKAHATLENLRKQYSMM